MNSKMTKLMMAIGAMALAGGAMAADATATASAVVAAPIAITKATDLDFGRVFAGNGTVTLTSDNNVALTGNSIPLPVAGGTRTAARFNVTGDGANTFSIDISASDALLTSSGSGNPTMGVSFFARNAADAVETPVTGGMLSAGSASFYVGGTLKVGATQAAGSYAGTVRATVVYN